MIILGITKYKGYQFIILDNKQIIMKSVISNQKLSIGKVYDENLRRKEVLFHKICEAIRENSRELFELEYLSEGVYIVEINKIYPGSKKDKIKLKRNQKYDMKNFDFFFKNCTSFLEAARNYPIYAVIKKSKHLKDDIVLNLLVLNGVCDNND